MVVAQVCGAACRIRSMTAVSPSMSAALNGKWPSGSWRAAPLCEYTRGERDGHPGKSDLPSVYCRVASVTVTLEEHEC
jgi:hypothetical protein